MRRAAPFLVLALVVAVFIFVVVQKNNAPTFPSVAQNTLATVVLDGETIRVTIADTETEREKGLGGRQGLAPDEGMLFVFPADGNYAFWMKDMLFAIDIVWLAADGTVMDMQQAVSPATYPEVFEPQALARYVLELPAGYAKVHTLKVGDKAAL